MSQYKTWIFCCSMIAICHFVASAKWPAAPKGMIIVPLVIRRRDFTRAALATFQQGLYDIQNKTCVRFVPRKDQRNYMYIYDGGRNDCSSPIGMRGGRQDLKLTTGCMMTRKKCVHEMIHGLGFNHMHQRFDRNKSLYVNYTNIALVNRKWFAVLNNKAEAYGTAYDYLSCMHYAKDGFSKNGRDTLIPHDNTYLDKIGVQLTLSNGDATRINRMYNCPPPYQ